MKIEKCDDREISSPPCTCFALFPEDDSDLAFIAELVEPKRRLYPISARKFSAESISSLPCLFGVRASSRCGGGFADRIDHLLNRVEQHAEIHRFRQEPIKPRGRG